MRRDGASCWRLLLVIDDSAFLMTVRLKLAAVVEVGEGEFGFRPGPVPGGGQPGHEKPGEFECHRHARRGTMMWFPWRYIFEVTDRA